MADGFVTLPFQAGRPQLSENGTVVFELLRMVSGLSAADLAKSYGPTEKGTQRHFTLGDLFGGWQNLSCKSYDVQVSTCTCDM